MRYSALIWLFPIVTALHTGEEAIWFPAWAGRQRRWPVRFTARRFRIAVLLLTLAAFAVTGLSAHPGTQFVWTYLAFGYAAAVLANVFVPHLAVPIATRTHMPGLGAAVLLNLPVLSLLVISALKDGYVSGWKAVEF